MEEVQFDGGTFRQLPDSKITSVSEAHS
jgi:hypothetical protein